MDVACPDHCAGLRRPAPVFAQANGLGPDVNGEHLKKPRAPPDPERVTRLYLAFRVV
jgi:hypothetical protein